MYVNTQVHVCVCDNLWHQTIQVECGGGYMKLGPKMDDATAFGDPTVFRREPAFSIGFIFSQGGSFC